MKPNIFNLATKELSQDSFFTWLLQWASSENYSYNQQLNNTAQDFIRLLIGKFNDYKITKVKAGRQWNNIDIWAEINDEYFIVIEDKTDTGEHSKQLERYKKIAEDHYKGKNFILIFIYLKTGNESLTTLKKITEKGYKITDRKQVLQILNQRQVQNEIFIDFLGYLTAIEDQTNSFMEYNKIISNWRAAEGFYLKLQEEINEWTDWRYVPNQTGGFLGFWYHWNGTKEIGEIYIQIENSFEFGIKLVVKIADWNPSTDLLYQLLYDIKPIAEKNHLSISKPDRFRSGTTSTLAIIENAFSVDNIGNLKLKDFLNTLSRLENTIDEYCKTKKINHSS